MGRRAVPLAKIVSGGQTGVDRGALEGALALGIAHGGYCPLGRRAEDGRIPEQFQLTETSTDKYPQRTALNVKSSDGTLLLVRGRACFEKSRGTQLTLELCVKYERPWWVADPRRESHADKVALWVVENGINVLNVAGPRESRYPGISNETKSFMRMVSGRLS